MLHNAACLYGALVWAYGLLDALATCIGNRAELAQRLLRSALAALGALFADLYAHSCMEGPAVIIAVHAACRPTPARCS